MSLEFVKLYEGVMRSLKNVLIKFLSPLITFFRIINYNALPTRLIRPTAIDALYDRAQVSSAKYIEQNISTAMIFKERTELWSYALDSVTVNGINLEFGVSWGKSINYFSKILGPERKIFGFDSFLGLKQDFFGTPFTQKSFSTGGSLPRVNKNVELIVGWFSETLPEFLLSHVELFSFVHLDADTYESTIEVLDLISDRITLGTVIVFDEYIGIPNWMNNEYRAWAEFVEKRNLKYQYIAFSPQSVAIKII